MPDFHHSSNAMWNGKDRSIPDSTAVQDTHMTQHRSYVWHVRDSMEAKYRTYGRAWKPSLHILQMPSGTLLEIPPHAIECGTRAGCYRDETG